MAHLLSVNLAHVRPNPATRSEVRTTGIDKRPVDHPVRLRAPGPKEAGQDGGLIGDRVVDVRHHGGDDQAVYAYARESLDHWERELGRELAGGVFGENLTTAGLDVDSALIGERWRIGEQVLLEVSSPRIPCSTFARWMDERGWVKRFAEGALPGAYLRIVEPGVIRAGDPVTVEHRPDHDVTVELCFRALMTEAQLLPRLVDVEELPEETRELARRRTGLTPPYDPEVWEADA
ncbi:MOSC domain-containing protein [Kitasatospora sp. NPDC048540]|uniref:MOSC domain-containing protein n=1 Tax=unclassified Kitasatospora TaxID=2633591 RepID=UPI00053A100A|nr:MOSC domain-containing protein [Kitasatospora sp. MBT63]